MEKKRLLVYFVVLLLGLVISFYTIRAHFDIRTVGSLLFLLIFIPTLINPDIGLVIIIVSMLFSPELIIGETIRREISIRIEDVFLLVIILAWFLRIAFTKDIGRVFKTKLTLPFFSYIAVCVISVVFAVVFSGDIVVSHAFLSTLKYLQYFLLFLMVKNNMRSFKQLKIFVLIFILTALIVSVYSNVYIQEQEQAGIEFFRTHPPVETRGGGESGTLGGYLVLMMGIVGGLLLYTRSIYIMMFFLIQEALMFRAFIYSLSRGSYLAFLPMLIALVYFTKKEKILVISIFVSLGILTLAFMPDMVRERILTTVIVERDVKEVYVEWAESPRARLDSWRQVVFEKLPRSPIFGHGVGKFFIDSQLFLTLCEVGLAGFALFAWVLIRLFKMVISVMNEDIVVNNNFSVGLALGFLAGYTGLLVQALSTNTFIIIRIMEPFWFMAAMVVSLPQLLKQEEGVSEEEGV